MLGEPGSSLGIGDQQTGLLTPATGSVHMFTRRADTPDAGHVTVEHWNDFDGGDDLPFVKGPTEDIALVPMRAAQFPPSFDICDPVEHLPGG
jgi:hypothetical protein